LTLEHANNIINKLIYNVEKIIRGKRNVISLIITGIIAGGHILLEDYPGCGKTTLAKTLSYSIGSDDETAHDMDHTKFKRIQFTPDLLPSDIIGVNIYDQKKGEFRFSPGPVFSNIVLADEINRANPKVQSALLESMAEKQVTVDNITYALDSFFFVIGTQNPLEVAGTYPLPLVQLDRFLMKLDIGYIDATTEIEVLKEFANVISKPNDITKVCTKREILSIRKLSELIFCEEEIYKAIVSITQRTRNHSAIRFGASTRSSIMLLQAVKSYALINNRDYVIEDDIKYLASHVLYHRLQFKEGIKNPKNLLQGIIDECIEEIIQSKRKFI